MGRRKSQRLPLRLVFGSYRLRAVTRSENPGGHVILGGDNVPPLVEIGLTDLTKSGGHEPPGPPACDGPGMYQPNQLFIGQKIVTYILETTKN